MLTRLIIFLVINFLALYLGSIFTAKEVSGVWYQTLNKAPWTPPGFVFGLAWTTVMICYAAYMAKLTGNAETKNIALLLYAIQLVLNIGWNPLFFYYKQVIIALIVIILLFLLIWFFFFYFNRLGNFRYFLLPYGFWLLIATSLNVFIAIKN